jgi:hypothetical protein
MRDYRSECTKQETFDKIISKVNELLSKPQTFKEAGLSESEELITKGSIANFLQLHRTTFSRLLSYNLTISQKKARAIFEKLKIETK